MSSHTPEKNLTSRASTLIWTHLECMFRCYKSNCDCVLAVEKASGLYTTSL